MESSLSKLYYLLVVHAFATLFLTPLIQLLFSCLKLIIKINDRHESNWSTLPLQMLIKACIIATTEITRVCHRWLLREEMMTMCILEYPVLLRLFRRAPQAVKLISSYRNDLSSDRYFFHARFFCQFHDTFFLTLHKYVTYECSLVSE